jgi:DNA-binding transcriptional ArsR family regulator
MSNRKPSVLLIQGATQMRALSAPLRIRIFEALARAGAPLSAGDVARAIDRPAAALYRHLEILRRAGLILAAGYRGSGRKREKLYEAAARALQSATPETPVQRRAFSRMGEAHARYALRCFSRAARLGTAQLKKPARDTSVRHLLLRLSPRQLVAFNRELDALAFRWMAPAGRGRPNLSFAIVMGPLERR